MSQSSHLAVSMGDPAGIGPEIILHALQLLEGQLRRGEMKLTVLGEETSLEAAARSLGHSNWRDPFVPGSDFIACGRLDSPHTFGATRADCGRLAYLAVERGVDLVLKGEADALVTAPLNKEALNLAGYKFSGHTEILAELTGVPDTFMMLAHGDLRVSHVTTHVPLARVPSLVTPERVTRAVEATQAMLKSIGIERPRLALAALNPHAGEAGVIGTEDDDVLVPVVKALSAKGYDITGPVPGDTVFVRAAAGQFDCVIANYHDQGHIPVKLLGFQVDRKTGRWTGLSGVNVTLGLPIIRTSVDHGTAFDIAGRGIANPQSLIEAIEYAAQMVASRNQMPVRGGVK